MPIEDHRIRKIVNEEFDGREPRLMAAAAHAGRLAAEAHCAAAHRELFDASARIEAGNLYIIDNQKLTKAELSEIKELQLEQMKHHERRQGAKGVLVAALGLFTGGGLLTAWKWIHTHLLGGGGK